MKPIAASLRMRVAHVNFRVKVGCNLKVYQRFVSTEMRKARVSKEEKNQQNGTITDICVSVYKIK